MMDRIANQHRPEEFVRAIERNPKLPAFSVVGLEAGGKWGGLSGPEFLGAPIVI
jgi:hypothetical protein